MNYGNIITCDVANGEGIRTTLFVSGCRRHCPGCFNKCTWDFNYGKPFTDETAQFIMNQMNHPYISGLTVLGGEPMEVENQKVIADFLELVKSKYPDKTVWLYTGYTYEELIGCVCTEDTTRILNCIDVLVDGSFIQSKKNPSLAFMGSENQRVIDMVATRQAEGNGLVLVT